MRSDDSSGIDCRIRDIGIELFDWQSEPFRALDERGRVGPEMHNGLLRLECDHRLEGHCFLGGMGQPPQVWAHQIDAALSGAILGLDVREREALWSQLPRLIGHSPSLLPGWAASDIALWDLTGKHLGLPVVDLLGRARRSVPAYATHPPMHAGIDELVHDILALKAEGFGVYKWHPGATPVPDVVTGVAAIRRAVGPDFGLILDPGNRYTLDMAFQVGRALDSAGFLWFEDPLPVGDDPHSIELARRIDTPVALSDSASFDLRHMARLVSTGHFTVLRGSSRWLGITGLKRACSLMDAHGGFCEVGLGGNPSMNAANLHVMQSTANARLYEHWIPSARYEFGTVNTLRPTQGEMSIAGSPGLGVELDENWLSDHRVDARHLHK